MIKKRNISLRVKRIAILGSVMTLGVTLLSGTANALVAPSTLGSSPAVTEAVVAPATLHVVKKVINSFGGPANETSFVIHVTQNGIDVAGSPVTTLGGTGRSFSLAPGDYIIYEERIAGYRGVWSGTISTGGTVSLVSGQDLTVTRTNFDMDEWNGVPAVLTPTTTTPEATEDGGLLPNTSSPWWNLVLLGGGLIALGSIGAKSRKSSIK